MELAGMALQMVRSFFGQGTPSRSRVHEPVIGIESLGDQEGNSSYDRGDVGKSAASNWFELARHPTSELGRKPHRLSKIQSKVDNLYSGSKRGDQVRSISLQNRFYNTGTPLAQ